MYVASYQSGSPAPGEGERHTPRGDTIRSGSRMGSIPPNSCSQFAVLRHEHHTHQMMWRVFEVTDPALRGGDISNVRGGLEVNHMSSVNMTSPSYRLPSSQTYLWDKSAVLLALDSVPCSPFQAVAASRSHPVRPSWHPSQARAVSDRLSVP